MVFYIETTGGFMDLREYLFIEKMKYADFARKIDYNREHITRIVTGKCFPGRRLAEKIVEATGGKVTIEELKKQEDSNKVS